MWPTISGTRRETRRRVTMITEPYEGAFFTLRYDQCKDRITGWGFSEAWDAVFDNQTGAVSATDYPKFYALKATLVKRFELRNMYKEISAETPDQWMFLCEQMIADAASKFEVVLAMETHMDLSSPEKEGQTVKYGHKIDTAIQDTPYGQLSDTSDYVSGRTGTYHSGEDTILTRNDLDAYVMMDLRRKWEDNVKMIIEYFDDLFIRIVGGSMVL